MSKRVLITGAGGGFGILMVNSLLENGHKVAAAMRDVNGRNKNNAEEISKKGGFITEIDVTDENSVNEGVEKAVNALGGLDVLINNAGVGSLGMQEYFTGDDYRKLYDINVFGVQRMNRAVLPLFRSQNSGLIIYISSLLGRIALPFYGVYNSSKWALEAMAENYRMETSGFGVENCILEPGGYPTAFINNLVYPSDNSRTDSYGDFNNVPQMMLKGFEQALANNPEQNPQKVADTVLDLINIPKGQKPLSTFLKNSRVLA